MDKNILLISGIVYSLLLTFAAVLVWRKKTGAKIKPFIAGALIFLVFATGLEQISHYFCLIADNAVSAAIKANKWLYAVYGAAAAAVFEETGRLVAFKTLLRKDCARETSVAYGIGHGGIEVILILGVTYATYLFMQGSEAVAASIAALTPGMCAVACVERFFTLLFHISLSVFVFASAMRPGKSAFFLLALILHFAADFVAVFYQVGVIPLMATEVFIGVFSMITLFFAIRLYKTL